MTTVYVYEKERTWCHGLKVGKGENKNPDQNIIYINTRRFYNFLPNDQ